MPYRRGQFEAGYSQGFNTVQVMVYIILPQAYRNVVPTLLSQVITTIKDSSFLANVATIELMARVKKILSNANIYNGTGTTNVFRCIRSVRLRRTDLFYYKLFSVLCRQKNTKAEDYRT